MKLSTFTNSFGAAALACTLVASACSSTTGGEVATESNEDSSSTNEVFDSSTIHTITIDFDQDDYDAMIGTYLDSAEKDWIEASVTINGTTFDQAGVRLKGNSSLRRIANNEGGSFDDPSGIPWLIRLDKFVDGQNHDGVTDFVVRSNGSETALNEAVALDLLEAAGLATQDAIAVRFSVNESGEPLRLVIENPEDTWLEQNFDSSDALYKAESTGDYSYRGEDSGSYEEVFDQEAGKTNTDLGPLIDFLDFINNSDDDTFNAELVERFDVESFAVYLAMQEIVNNLDDIDGPGNNSYLHWDSKTGIFTVVPWDYNESFGYARGVQNQATQAPDVGDQRADDPRDQLGGARPQRGGGDGTGSENILVERFNNNEQFSALYAEKLAELTADLVDSGLAGEFLSEWVVLLENEATDLVPSNEIEAEADHIRTFFQ